MASSKRLRRPAGGRLRLAADAGARIEDAAGLVDELPGVRVGTERELEHTERLDARRAVRLDGAEAVPALPAGADNELADSVRVGCSHRRLWREPFVHVLMTAEDHL